MPQPTKTLLDSGEPGNVASFNTASITVNAGELCVIQAGYRTNGGAGNALAMTATGNTVARFSDTHTVGNRGQGTYYFMPTSNFTGVIGISNTLATPDAWAYSVVKYSGALTGSNGATALANGITSTLGVATETPNVPASGAVPGSPSANAINVAHLLYEDGPTMGIPPTGYANIFATSPPGVEVRVSVDYSTSRTSPASYPVTSSGDATEYVLHTFSIEGLPTAVTGTGALTSPSSTIAGAGVVHHTSTGALTSPSSTISGSGTVNGSVQHVTGTGALTSPSSTMSGAGKRGIVDVGGAVNLSSPSSLISGSGVINGAVQHYTGTGALTSPTSLVAGAAVLRHTGAGALLSPSSSIPGSGVIGHSGSGALLSPTSRIGGGSSNSSPPRNNSMERMNNSPNVVGVTPSDTTVYNPALIALRVGTTPGTLVVKSGSQTVTIPNVLAGETIYGSFNQVMAASTAVGITGFQWPE